MKELIKYLFFSEAVADSYKILRNIKGKKIFTGVYDNWKDVVDEDPWNNEGWIEKSKQKLEQNKDINSSSLTVPPNATEIACYAIPALVLNQMSSKKKCNILDYGGGTGDVYYKIVRSLIQPENINYYVLDNPTLMELGEKYKEAYEQIFFCHNIPKKIDFDIVLISTTLQYIEDYKKWLEPVIDLNPKYFLFMRLWAGDFSNDFITSQNVHGKITPLKIINHETFINHMASANYSVIFQGPCSTPIKKEYLEGIPEEFMPLFDINVVMQRDL